MFLISDWSCWGSIFYWAVYMAWAPISAMFIGKVCYGQTVRKVMMLTLVGPSLFTAVWMAIFSGISMNFELAGYGIANAYQQGYEYTTYAVFRHLPLIKVLPLFDTPALVRRCLFLYNRVVGKRVKIHE